MEYSDKMLGALMQTVSAYNDWGIAIGLSQIRDQIDYYTETMESHGSGWQIPDVLGNKSVHRCIEHLVHQGALERTNLPGTKQKTYCYPIPSFQSYLIEQARFTAAEALAIGQRLLEELPKTPEKPCKIKAVLKGKMSFFTFPHWYFRSEF